MLGCLIVQPFVVACLCAVYAWALERGPLSGFGDTFQVVIMCYNVAVPRSSNPLFAVHT